jgi:uncharacterized protein DUF6458
MTTMGIGVSIFLIAIGAILVWAVNAEVAGIDIDAVGVILMVVGGIGILLSLIFWSSWGGVTRRREVVVDDRGPVA